MHGNDIYVGLVLAGRFKSLAPKTDGGYARLTTIQMQTAQSPESAELDLAKYENSAIAVQGHLSGDWIYSARVIDTAGPIVTALVKHVFAE